MNIARLSSKYPLYQYQIFFLVDLLCSRFEETCRRGRPRRFSDATIIKCIADQVYHRIHRFRELEWKLKQDF